MTNTISYREIAKLIHPDLNPDIDDPAEKLRKIKVFRKNDTMLFKFGVEWGIIEPVIKVKRTVKIRKVVSNIINPSNLWSSKNYVPNPVNKTIHRGDRIYIKTLDIHSICVKVSPKRIYFRKSDGKVTFCKRSNATKEGV